MHHFPTPTSTSTRSVAILTGPSTHLDHLGVLSAILKIPLIVTEEKTFQLAKRYYPQIDVSLMDMSDLSMDFLCSQFDAIFESGKFWALELKPFMEMLYRKKMRFVFCPHGNSDKGHSLKEHPDQDVSLVYGGHLQDHLQKTGALDKIRSIVATGNYRYPFYQQYKAFYDQIAEEEIFSRFQQKRKTVLYAPTWQDKENPSSFFQATEELIEQLSPTYNLLIKLHPFLIEDHIGKVLSVQHRYESHPGVHFVDEFPPIYPLLNQCDIYLGDYSSIGYDFLAFDRPLYFYNPIEDKTIETTPRRYTGLATCGIEIPHSQKCTLNRFFEETLSHSHNDLSTMRKALYAYAFGKEKSPETLQKEIFEATDTREGSVNLRSEE